MAEHFQLPVKTETDVETIEALRQCKGFVIQTYRGELRSRSDSASLRSQFVIWAAGEFHVLNWLGVIATLANIMNPYK